MAIPGKHKKECDFRCFRDPVQGAQPTQSRPRTTAPQAVKYYKLPLTGRTPTIFLCNRPDGRDLMPHHNRINPKNLIWNPNEGQNGSLDLVNRRGTAGPESMGVDVIHARNSGHAKQLLSKLPNGRYFIAINRRLYIGTVKDSRPSEPRMVKTFANRSARPSRTASPRALPRLQNTTTRRPTRAPRVWSSEPGQNIKTVHTRSIRLGSRSKANEFIVRASRKGIISYRVKMGPNKVQEYVFNKFTLGSRTHSVRPGMLYRVKITSTGRANVYPISRPPTGIAGSFLTSRAGAATPVLMPQVYDSSNPYIINLDPRNPRQNQIFYARTDATGRVTVKIRFPVNTTPSNYYPQYSKTRFIIRTHNIDLSSRYANRIIKIGTIRRQNSDLLRDLPGPTFAREVRGGSRSLRHLALKGALIKITSLSGKNVRRLLGRSFKPFVTPPLDSTKITIRNP